eukprot:863228-Rhodomonas_salina.1
MQRERERWQAEHTPPARTAPSARERASQGRRRRSMWRVEWGGVGPWRAAERRGAAEPKGSRSTTSKRGEALLSVGGAGLLLSG